MLDVEFGIAFAYAEVGGVAENRLGVVERIADAVGDAREDIERVREGVVEVHLDIVRKAFAENDQESLIVGPGLVGEVVVADELRRDADVGGQQSWRAEKRRLGQDLDDIEGIALLQRNSVGGVDVLGAVGEAE